MEISLRLMSRLSKNINLIQGYQILGPCFWNMEYGIYGIMAVKVILCPVQQIPRNTKCGSDLDASLDCNNFQCALSTQMMSQCRPMPVHAWLDPASVCQEQLIAKYFQRSWGHTYYLSSQLHQHLLIFGCRYGAAAAPSNLERRELLCHISRGRTVYECHCHVLHGSHYTSVIHRPQWWVTVNLSHYDELTLCK